MNLTSPRPPTVRALPGQWKCPHCGFHLFRRIFYAKTGNVGLPDAAADVAEPCPNDGALLERVTELVH